MEVYTMANPMRRPAFRARIQWHTWMPWYEFSRIAGEFQDHDERAGGMLPPALGIALVTLVAAVLVPQLSLLITVAGGGSIVWALTCATGDGRRIIRGVKVVGLPSPRTFLALSAEMATDDMKALWHGRPRPTGLLAGPNEAEWTREETINRYHLWRQARESLPPADRDVAAIAATVGFAHEELMDALLGHRLKTRDLAAGRQMPALPAMLELKLLASPDARSTVPMSIDAGGDYGTDTAEAGFDAATGRGVAIRRPSHRDQQNGRVRPRHERLGRAGMGTGQLSPALPEPGRWRKQLSRGGQHERHHADLEAARGLIDAAADRPDVGDGGYGDE